MTNADIITLLEDVSQALDDWLTTYSAEMCNEDRVREAKARIYKAGGTLHYGAELMERCDVAVAELEKKTL